MTTYCDIAYNFDEQNYWYVFKVNGEHWDNVNSESGDVHDGSSTSRYRCRQGTPVDQEIVTASLIAGKHFDNTPGSSVVLGIDPKEYKLYFENRAGPFTGQTGEANVWSSGHAYML